MIGKKIKSYENYKIFYDGHVENMRYNPHCYCAAVGLPVFKTERDNDF